MLESDHKPICVYCASSQRCAQEYRSAAYRLGQILAREGYPIIYGGGGIGSMGALADGALSNNGHVIGVLPEFMQKLEWGHKRLSELQVVDDLRARKHAMLEGSGGVVALPGGSGTLEELLESITLKRLGLFLEPIILVNTRGFFNPLLDLLRSAVTESFMDNRHLEMWHVVSEPEAVVEALLAAPKWSSHARAFATLV